MRQISSKSQLAIVLSRLKGFQKPKVRQEQYIMDSETGASALWNAYLIGDIGGKVIADLGCGTGILGIGCLLLGAKEAILVDSDPKALDLGKNNISIVESEGYKLNKAKFELKDIKEVKNLEVDAVIQNPPFGTKTKHIDRVFLEKALETAPLVYSFHKSETSAFLERFAAQKNARITHRWPFKYPLKSSYSFHRRRIHRIDVTCFRFERLR